MELISAKIKCGQWNFQLGTLLSQNSDRGFWFWQQGGHELLKGLNHRLTQALYSGNRGMSGLNLFCVSNAMKIKRMWPS